jgi:hypothetical protein
MDVITASLDALRWTAGLVKLDMRCPAITDPRETHIQYIEAARTFSPVTLGHPQLLQVQP